MTFVTWGGAARMTAVLSNTSEGPFEMLAMTRTTPVTVPARSTARDLKVPVVLLAGMTKSIVRVPVENCTEGSSLGTEALGVNATLTVPEISTEYGDDNAIDNSNDCVGFTLSGNPVSDNVGNGAGGGVGCGGVGVGCGGEGVGSGGGGVGSGGGGVGSGGGAAAILTVKVREAVRGLLPLPRLSATWIVKVKLPAVRGVPVRSPELDKLRPDGTDPEMTDHL
jgi:hypothetical protein